MHRKTAVVVLLAVVTVSAALLYGCRNKSAASSASGSDVKPVETSIAEGGESAPGVGLQSVKEKLLVQLFRGLLLMDKKPELAIQRAQAEQMLPMIQKSRGSGEMTAADRRKIIDLLTNEQRAFLLDIADKLRQGGESGIGKAGGNRMKDMSDEERRQILAELRKKRESEIRDKPKDGKRMQVPPAKADTNDDWASGEKSVEQQLVELLDARVK